MNINNHTSITHKRGFLLKSHFRIPMENFLQLSLSDFHVMDALHDRLIINNLMLLKMSFLMHVTKQSFIRSSPIQLHS